jgi:hypothetical protein
VPGQAEPGHPRGVAGELSGVAVARDEDDLEVARAQAPPDLVMEGEGKEGPPAVAAPHHQPPMQLHTRLTAIFGASLSRHGNATEQALLSYSAPLCPQPQPYWRLSA